VKVTYVYYIHTHKGHAVPSFIGTLSYKPEGRMSSRKFPESKARKADNLTANVESIVFQENGCKLLKKYSEMRRYLFNCAVSKLHRKSGLGVSV
jgi:recombinational DNA repair ATPase RecF